ncbi:MAG: HlyD family efflux transporter periplasmic adaptor subunit [Lewinellaceae bacterium]|nr:HlyD family efflux transporter periplasmic adaptor subunit [Lewinellaceae bacterium]
MEYISKINELEDSDEPVREILGKVPGWLVRWGNMLILLFFISLIAIANLIKFPESILTSTTILSVNAPKPVISNAGGKLVWLDAREGLHVTKGALLGFMESLGKHRQVLDLYERLNQLKSDLNEGEVNKAKWLDLKSYRDLGELQQDFQVFSQACIAYRNYLAGGLYPQKRAMLKADLAHLALLNENLKKQKSLLEQDFVLSQQTFNMSETLMEEKLISESELRNEKSRLLGKKLTLPQVEASMIANETQQNEKRKEILELDDAISKQTQLFQEALDLFRGQTEEWMKKYILTAPVDGIVAFNSFIQVNQQIQPDQLICYINPGDSHYFAEAYIPQDNFGKIAIGQEVLLRFPSYPYQEYGLVRGKIEFISHIGTEQGYLSKIALPDNLSTTADKKIQYREGLTANAEIITKDMNLIERFYYTILRLKKY